MFSPLNKSGKHDAGVDIDPARLCVGLFIRLNLRWTEHNFMFNQFRIASEAQVRALQALGLKSITYFPARSIAEPLSPEDLTRAARAGAAPDTGIPAAVTDGPATTNVAEPKGEAPPLPPAPASPQPFPDKALQAQRLAAQRAEIAKCERNYTAAAVEVRSVMRDVFAAGGKAMTTARALIGNMVKELPESGEIVIHLMNERLAEETAYFHVLNVMVLSILLGRELKLPPEVLTVLGEAALMHDIGLQRIPEAIIHNGKRNRHEEDLFRMHPVYGREMTAKLEGLAVPAREVVELHHERLDGKGYPHGFTGEKIPLLARLIGITNRYEELCNPIVTERALTPAEALGHMYKVEDTAWDRTMLQAFIRLLGVYPPGSLVQLSNGNIALVVAVDHADLLRPSVLVFDPATPREDALVVDLVSEPDVLIDMVLKPRDLDPDALAYLAPKRRMSYYHGPHRKS